VGEKAKSNQAAAVSIQGLAREALWDTVVLSCEYGVVAQLAAIPLLSATGVRM
jgi:hypothetical protein